MPSIPFRGQTPSYCIRTSSTPSMAITLVQGKQRTQAGAPLIIAKAPIDQPWRPPGILVLFIIYLLL